MLIMMGVQLYIGISAALWGMLCLRGLRKIGISFDSGMDEMILTGLIMLTVYAQFWSLFSAVSGSASLVTLGMNLLGIILLFAEYKKGRILFSFQREHYCKLCVGIVLFIIICAISSLESWHFDTELYHAQAIRWIEEYGVIKGGVNLLSNLGYNSSAFCLQALFSFKWLTGQSYRVVNGAIACILTIWAVLSMKIVWKRKFTLSDIFRLGILLVGYYPSETASVATDRIIAYLIMYIIAKWVAVWEETEPGSEKRIHRQAYLVMVAAWTLTIKLSAAPILLLAIIPIAALAKKKRYALIAEYSLLAAIIISPYLIRNVILSGYLVYPFAGIDLLDVPWKIAKDAVESDAYQIKFWGYGLQKETVEWRNSHNILDWIGYWFGNLSLRNKACMLISALMAIVLPVREIVKKEWEKLGFYLVIFGSIIFWLFNAPLIRYGQAYLYFGILSMVGWILSGLYTCKIKYMESVKRPLVPVLWVGISLFMLLPSVVATGVALRTYPIRPADYRVAEGDSFEVDGVMFWYPLESDQEGYHLFPAVARKPGDKPGFRLAEYGNLRAGFLPSDTQ